MPIHYPLDYTVERMLRERPPHASVEEAELRALGYPPEVVRSELPRVLDHKWYMSERMGRDVGIRVAAVDYFDNVNPESLERKVRRDSTSLRGLEYVVEPVFALERVLSSFLGTLRGTLLLIP